MATRKVDKVTVIEHDGPLALPKGMSISRGIKVLEEERTYRETTVELRAPIDGFLPDVAHAFYQVLIQRYGYAQTKSRTVQTFFGPKDEPPLMLTVTVGLNEHVEVPWGKTTVPGVEGFLEPEVENHNGRARFVMGGRVKRKHEETVKEIVQQIKDYLRLHSVFRGQAFRLRWTTENERGIVMPVPFPEPTFLDINRDLKNELVFSAEVEHAIQTNVFTPIVRTELVRKLGVPRKRGILLSGKYGTGKSMTSTVVADLATSHGWTFLLCERANELGEMLRLAREYGPAVVFCEDIDRVMSGERDVSMDEVLNIIDGVESKNVELMVILTTNHVENINQAMLRPGRLDAVIDVKPPDADAAARLMRLYGRGLISVEENVGEAARLLSGQIPSVIQEVVEKSKLAAVFRDPNMDFGPGTITGADLVTAAHTMQNQLRLLEEHKPDTRSEHVKAAQVVADSHIEAARIRAKGDWLQDGYAEGVKDVAGA